MKWTPPSRVDHSGIIRTMLQRLFGFAVAGGSAAVEARDAESARNAMTDHLVRTRRDIESTMTDA